MNVSTIFWGLLFGSVGFGYFVYGKKQRAIVPFISGLVLMVFPYFISNPIALVVTGVAIAVVPYFVRI